MYFLFTGFEYNLRPSHNIMLKVENWTEYFKKLLEETGSDCKRHSINLINCKDRQEDHKDRRIDHDLGNAIDDLF